MSKNHKKYKSPLFVLLCLGVVILVSALYLRGTNIAVLNPKGSIAEQQFDLIVFTSLLSLLIIVPVFALTFYIAFKYRASNKKAKYNPDLDHNTLAEALWWGIPLLLISVLAVITFITSHKLDPYRPIESDKKPVTIQVVALQWKWLFIYPDENIATVNHIQVPEKTPINFELTSDAPMNSFWIPQLGGQVYAMAGMRTKLHLIADKTGTYKGSSANISGEGFADMKFTVKATSEAEYREWVSTVRMSPAVLTKDVYQKLAEPGKAEASITYSGRDETLYDTVIMKYMSPEVHHKEVVPESAAQGREGTHSH